MRRTFKDVEFYLKPKDLGYFGFIYLITNQINNKIYIGQTQLSISRRFYSHCAKRHTEKMPIKEAIQKYGKENFSITILHRAKTPEELNQKEAEYIKSFNSIDSSIGYNIRTGGDDLHLIPEREAYRVKRVREGLLNSPNRLKGIEALKRYTSSIKGKKLNQEERFKRSLFSKNRKIVEAINRSTGEIIYFESAKTAGLYFGNYLMISGACRGKKPSYKNHIFRYVGFLNV